MSASASFACSRTHLQRSLALSSNHTLSLLLMRSLTLHPRQLNYSSLRARAGAIRVPFHSRSAARGAPFPLNVRESTHSLLPTHPTHARARSSQVSRRSAAAATAPLAALAHEYAHEYARIHSLRSLSNHHAHALASLALCSFSPRAQYPRATHAIHSTPAHRNTRQGLGSCPLSAVHSRCLLR